MKSEPAPEKRELRRKLRALLMEMTEGEVRTASFKACDLLRGQAIWKKARSVLFYSALPGEINLSTLLEDGLQAGKAIALPRFISDTGAYDAFQIRDVAGDCAPGKFGITEPSGLCEAFPLKQLDLVLVPGVAFDATGLRLGRGQGFYDRLLAEIEGVKCGVAFDRQIVGRVPHEGHDVRMNYILTPTRWLEIAV